MKNHPVIKFGKTGILIINLGTPDSTRWWDIRKYLNEFLSDKRVIEVNPIIWKIILNLFILIQSAISENIFFGKNIVASQSKENNHYSKNYLNDGVTYNMFLTRGRDKVLALFAVTSTALKPVIRIYRIGLY